MAGEGAGTGDADGLGDCDTVGDTVGELDCEPAGDKAGAVVGLAVDDEAAGVVPVIWWPVTRWPRAIVADPMCTSVGAPIGGGARSGLGAGCPLMLPAAG